MSHLYLTVILDISCNSLYIKNIYIYFILHEMKLQDGLLRLIIITTPRISAGSSLRYRLPFLPREFIYRRNKQFNANNSAILLQPGEV